MSYTDLNLSPRKKRRAISPEDDTLTTPKPRTPSTISPSKSKAQAQAQSIASATLPPHLSRLLTFQTSLQHALSVALATSAISPCTDTGRVPNVLTHFSLTTAMGFTMNCDVDDVRRLCWLWEWDGRTAKAKVELEEEDNPFVVKSAPAPPTDWTRGAMGFTLSPSTYFIRAESRRVPAYGIGIEVDMNLAEGKTGGMAAVARWTAEGDVRKRELEGKVKAWVKLHKNNSDTSLIPLASLPPLPTTKLTSLPNLISRLPSRSPSPTKGLSSPFPATPRGLTTPSTGKRILKDSEFAVPFPVTPQTPFGTPSKPREIFLSRSSSRLSTPSGSGLFPQTPSKMGAGTPGTPSTNRRAALYERIRLKSLGSDSAPVGSGGGGGGVTPRDRMRLLGQEEMRRRLLLGRLDKVAATVWALFSSPAQTSSTPLSVARKRRTMRMDEVLRAIISSSGIPISMADAQDSLNLLMGLCPFFLRPLVITGEEWVEMPSSNPGNL
ncbi:hypothetical protein M422DRAFT_61570 [Sphaerobolus stellatus SS14]|uniref:DNA replication factor Cdt1 C-terminal domain-containing protein n=1 Tax=Sphaerobolus stellatus (strain SS14) TaxID=990650 RepID=A0A0C9TQI5_SPHS4|nr:hypothetical protein M422DRAFT_61570 [Sphaerobolus stellatus SS14]